MSASSKKKLRKEQEAAVLTEKQLQEKKEAKSLKTYTIIFVLIMAIVLGVFGYSVIKQGLSNSGITQQLTTGVVINDQKLSSAELNYFYIDAISEQYNNWYNEYGENTDLILTYYIGLNVTSPLDQQFYDTEGKVSWAEFFADSAIKKATQVIALNDAAKAEGFALTEEDLKGIEDSIESIKLYAPFYGYSDLEAYLQGMYGKAANEKTFREYLERNTLAQSYYASHSESLVYGNTDLRDHEKEHFDEYSSFSFASFSMTVSDFTEGTTDENGNTTYTDEQKAAGLAAAAAAAETIQNSGASTPEALDKAIKGLSVYAKDDKAVSSKNVDVAYESINTQIVEWMCQEGRKAGDLGVLPVTSTSTDAEGKETTTTTGYFLVVYQGREDNNFALKDVRHILVEFEGGTTGTDGTVTYTEAEKLAAKNAAEELLKKFNETGKTSEDFAALAKENTDDTASAENGGLYEDVYPGQMVTNFNDWCFEEGRKTGDTGIVESPFGYHVMYFVGDADISYRDYMIKNVLRSEDMEAWLKTLVDSADVSGRNISHLDLNYIIAPASY